MVRAGHGAWLTACLRHAATDTHRKPWGGESVRTVRTFPKPGWPRADPPRAAALSPARALDALDKRVLK